MKDFFENKETEIIKKLQDENLSQSEKEKIFKELVDIYKNSLLNFVYNYIQPKGIFQDAEEIVLETFIRFYKNIKSFKQKSSVKTYIFRIATNLSINFLKSKKEILEPMEEIDEKFSRYFSEEERIIENQKNEELKILLTKIINMLPEKQRLALHLAKFQKMSYKEIADVLNTTVSSVESLLFRAKQNIKKNILKNKEFIDKLKNE